MVSGWPPINSDSPSSASQVLGRKQEPLCPTRFFYFNLWDTLLFWHLKMYRFLNCHSHYNFKNYSLSRTVNSGLCSLLPICRYPGFSQHTFKDENNFTFIYLYVCVSECCMCVHAPCACPMPVETRGGHRIIRNWSFRWS